MSDQSYKEEQYYCDCIRNFVELIKVHPKGRNEVWFLTQLNLWRVDENLPLKGVIRFWVTKKQFENLKRTNRKLYEAQHECENMLKYDDDDKVTQYGYSSKRGEAHCVYKYVKMVNAEGSVRNYYKYVWSGFHSKKMTDLIYLEKKIAHGAKFTSPYVKRFDLDENSIIEVPENLLDK